MPPIPSKKPEQPKEDKSIHELRVYEGLGLQLEVKGAEASCECCLCGKSGKFSINIKTSKWQCFACNTRGNQYTFIRELYEASKKTTSDYDYQELAEQRSLLFGESVAAIGAVKSTIDGTWLLPGYSQERKLVQLYRWKRMWDPDKQEASMKLLATPELPHGIHMIGPWDEKAKTVYQCEGPWDGAALYEVLSRSVSDGDGSLKENINGRAKLSGYNILAVPGCHVFNEAWCQLLSKKDLILLYDSDHPKINKKTEQLMPPVGLAGMKRVLKILSTSSHTLKRPPSSLKYLRWGGQGYDPELPSGFDLRDAVKEAETIGGRIEAMGELLKKIDTIPEDEWMEDIEEDVEGDISKPQLEPMVCTDYETLISAWEKAMKWTPGLNKALIAMLASTASTMMLGDQLWIRVMGPAACGKSTLCEALAVAKKYVLSKSTMRGFHSGYVAADGKDKSLVKMADGKTLVTKDGDTLLQAPNLSQILSEGRDVYDRVTRTSYRHGGDKDYEGHSMTWLLCGTSSLRGMDQSELGERFVDCVIMEKIDDDLEDEILSSVVDKALGNVDISTQNEPDKRQNPDLTLAMQLTGGYVEYLREHAEKLYPIVTVDSTTRHLLTRLGKMTAYLRARPSQRQDETAERELASRLTSQFARLAKSVAVVLNKEEVDDEVMDYVRQYAFDTGRGKTMKIANFLYERGDEGVVTQAVMMCPDIGGNEESVRKLLRFMKQIGAIEMFVTVNGGVRSQAKWKLTDMFHNLLAEVM